MVKKFLESSPDSTSQNRRAGDRVPTLRQVSYRETAPCAPFLGSPTRPKSGSDRKPSLSTTVLRVAQVLQHLKMHSLALLRARAARIAFRCGRTQSPRPSLPPSDRTQAASEVGSLELKRRAKPQHAALEAERCHAGEPCLERRLEPAFAVFRAGETMRTAARRQRLRAIRRTAKGRHARRCVPLRESSHPFALNAIGPLLISCREDLL